MRPGSANGFRYALLLFRGDHSSLGQRSIDVDWEPALECAWFEGLRDGRLVASQPIPDPAICPLWDDQLGVPYLRGFRVSLDGGADGPATCDLTTAYFRPLAEAAAAQLVEDGELDPGEDYSYLVAAFQHAEAVESRQPLRVERKAPELLLLEADLEEIAGGAEEMEATGDGQLPVFIPRRVLDEASTQARSVQGVETGGFLIGHLHRDPESGEIFVRVTAQLPARHTPADSVSLEFTAKTWTEIRAALGLRNRGELMLGWWHSHPVREWCKDCSEAYQRSCRLARDFFSSQDRALHRAVFPRAYSVALVVNDVAFSDPTFSLFGWEQGELEPRGFQITSSGREESECPELPRAS